MVINFIGLISGIALSLGFAFFINRLLKAMETADLNSDK
jgi:ABC-type lipoprotein release transport system permease subunit